MKGSCQVQNAKFFQKIFQKISRKIFFHIEMIAEYSEAINVPGISQKIAKK